MNITTTTPTAKFRELITRNLPGGRSNTVSDYVIAQFAIAYSLSTGKHFQKEDFLRSRRGEKSEGKQFKEDTLFQGRKVFFVALLSQHYGRSLGDEELAKLIVSHIDHGMAEFEKKDNFFQTLVSKVNALDESSGGGGVWPPIDEQKQKDASIDGQKQKDAYCDPIPLYVGDTVDGSDQEVKVVFNAKKRANCHVAIAGTTGCGKSQFCYDFLDQIYKKSGKKINFIYLDFKGATPSQEFRENTDLLLVSPKDNHPFPLNPVAAIDFINENRRKLDVLHFCDRASACVNLGHVQKKSLQEAIESAGELMKKTGKCPTLKDVNNELKKRYNENKTKEDKLTALMSNLSDLPFFDHTRNDRDFIDKNIYVSLGADLPEDARFTAMYFILNNIFGAFDNLKDETFEIAERHDCLPLRYVLLIDEAHNVFKHKKFAELVEQILRVIRSRGVAVVLASQSVDSFKTTNFDATSLCDSSVLFDVKDKNPKELSNFLREQDSKKISEILNKQQGSLDSGIKNAAIVRLGNDAPMLLKATQFYKKK